MTVHALTQLYLASVLRSRSSFGSTKRLLRQVFDPIRFKNVHELQRIEILTWHSNLASTPHHANRALGVLKAAIRWAIPLGLATHDPTHGIRRHPTISRSRYLSQQEISAVILHLTSAPLQFRCFILLLLLTGCRRGEARTARWVDFNFTEKLWTKPKTKANRWHVVPLTDQTISVLHALPRTTQWAFPGLNGQCWSASAIEKAWGRFRRNTVFQDVRLHDLRRTAASHLVINGENLTIVQAMLDHSTLQPTAIYARLNTSALARALQGNADRFLNQVNIHSICRYTDGTT